MTMPELRAKKEQSYNTPQMKENQISDSTDDSHKAYSQQKVGFWLGNKRKFTGGNQEMQHLGST